MNDKAAYLKAKEPIYQLSKQPNAIGKEWRERVEKLESELAAIEAGTEKEEGDEKNAEWRRLHLGKNYPHD